MSLDSVGNESNVSPPKNKSLNPNKVSNLLQSASVAPTASTDSISSNSAFTDREIRTPSPISSSSDSYKSITSPEGKHPRVKKSGFTPIQKEKLQEYGVIDGEVLIEAGALGKNGVDGKIYYKTSSFEDDEKASRRKQIGQGAFGRVTDAFLIKEDSVKEIAVKRIPGYESKKEAQFLKEYPSLFPQLEFLVEKESIKDQASGKTLIGMEKGSPIFGDHKSLSLDYIPQLIDLLIHAKNQNVMNWDIKPANLMSFEGKLKFIDAGYVDKEETDIAHNEIGQVGSPGYIYAPALDGKESTYSISKIYSFVFGLILFESLCGKVPGYFNFSEGNPTSFDLLSSIKPTSTPNIMSLMMNTSIASQKFNQADKSNFETINIIKAILGREITSLEEIKQHTHNGGALSVDELIKLKETLKIYKDTKLETKFNEIKQQISTNSAGDSVLLEINNTLFSEDQKNKLLQHVLKSEQKMVVDDEVINANLHILKLIDDHDLQINWPPNGDLSKEELYEAFFSKVSCSVLTSFENGKIAISSLDSSDNAEKPINTYLKNLFLEENDIELIAILNSSLDDSIKDIVFQTIEDYMYQYSGQILTILSSYSDFFYPKDINSYIEKFTVSNLEWPDKATQLHDFLTNLMLKKDDEGLTDIIQHLKTKSNSKSNGDVSKLYKSVLQTVDKKLRDTIYSDIKNDFKYIEYFAKHYGKHTLEALERVSQKMAFEVFDGELSAFLNQQKENTEVTDFINSFILEQVKDNEYYFDELPKIKKVIQENKSLFPGITFSDG